MTWLSRLRLLNVRYLVRHPIRTLLSLGVVAWSAALIVAVLGTYGSVGGSVSRLAEQIAGNASLEVSGVTDGGLDQALVPTIRAVPGVAAAVPLVQAPIVVEGQRILLFGSDDSARELSSSLRDAIDAVPRSSADTPGLWVGPGVTGVAQGSMTVVTAMTGAVTPVPIAGVLSGASASSLNSGRIAVAPLSVAQELTGRPGQLDSVLVVAAPGTDVAGLRQRLTDSLGGRAYAAVPAYRASVANGSTAMAQNVTLLVAFMALAVAGFLVFNTMNMAASERRPEIASLRALGARKGLILRDFLAEALIIGLLAAAGGSLVGVALAAATVSRLPTVLTANVDAHVEFVLPSFAVPAAIAACVAATVAASWLAAHRAAGVAPVEAMRPEGVGTGVAAGSEQARVRHTAALLVAGGLLGVAGVVAAVRFDDTRAMAASPLFLVGAILVSLAATGPLTRAVAAVSRRVRPAGPLAAASVQRSPRRIWATTTTVWLAVAIGVAITGASQNMVTAASEAVSTLKQTDFIVQGATKDELPVRPILPEGLAEQVRAVPGVARVTAGQFAYANFPDGRALVQGISGESNSTAYRFASEGARAEVLAGTGAVVSRLFARDHDVAVGDTLTLPTPAGDQRLRVADVVDYVSVDAGLVAISLDRLGEWFHRPGATFLEVQCAPNADRAAVGSALGRLAAAAALPVYVVTGAESVAATESAVQQVGALAAALQWIVACVAGLALLNTLMMSVAERRREFGILRALGANRRVVRRLVMAEALGVSIVGGIVGVVVGMSLQYVATLALGRVAALSVPLALPWAAAAMAIGAVAIALAGALPPARAAARLPVVEAIGYE